MPSWLYILIDTRTSEPTHIFDEDNFTKAIDIYTANVVRDGYKAWILCAVRAGNGPCTRIEAKYTHLHVYEVGTM